MTPLTEHLDRVGRAEGGLIEFELGDGAENPDLDDVCDGSDFAIAATDHNGHVMIVEIKISTSGRGLTAVVSTYNHEGQHAVASLTDIGHQVMVTVD